MHGFLIVKSNCADALMIVSKPADAVTVTLYVLIWLPERAKSDESSTVNVLVSELKLTASTLPDGSSTAYEYVTSHQSRAEANSGT
jgi:YD repeat-containing protein